MTFRDELLAGRVLLDMGSDGIYGRSGAFEDVVDGIAGIVHGMAVADGAPRVRFAPVEPRWVFDRTDYLNSFPDLTGAIMSFRGDDRDHAKLLAAAEAGEDWTSMLTPAGAMLCPAVCHPLYPTLTGTLPEGGARYEVQGWCFRHEPSLDPGRMQAFRQHEVVYVGEPDGARKHRDLWIERGVDVFTQLGLDVDAVVANDPFFGRVGRMLAANQRDEELKIEVVAEIASAENLTAIMSSNCHEDHFGAPFGITTASGDVAHSACVGFGLDRVTLALFRKHGLDLGEWPSNVRERLFG